MCPKQFFVRNCIINKRTFFQPEGCQLYIFFILCFLCKYIFRGTRCKPSRNGGFIFNLLWNVQQTQKEWNVFLHLEDKLIFANQILFDFIKCLHLDRQHNEWGSEKHVSCQENLCYKDEPKVEYGFSNRHIIIGEYLCVDLILYLSIRTCFLHKR
jgi:hypothetical protein